MLTQSRLKELLNYDPLTGVFTWRIPTTIRVKTGDIASNVSKTTGYRRIQVDGKMCRAHRLAWFCVYGYFPENDLDHIDRVRDNNAIGNLREVTRTCNTRNTGNRSTNKSGVKGVVWGKVNAKWRAQITINGKNINLGRFNCFTEAVYHRLAAEQAADWSGCDSSSPAYQYIMGIRNCQE